MEQHNRTRARELAKESIRQGESLKWFETLYAEAKTKGVVIPWADLEANPHLIEWVNNSNMDWHGKKALKIGCGLGDDAKYLSEIGLAVTAFDISETAIRWCHERFPDSRVDYQVADLFNLPETWDTAFDLVVESYTLQVLPVDRRLHAIEKISSLISPSGKAIVICRGRSDNDPAGEMPWPLTKKEIECFSDNGISIQSFEDFMDNETPPVRRFRVELFRT
ncbi:class I SAM-dependent methyltransferase [Sulfurovum sp.]|uniref:class I SAM-dependent methyltransferase n=1 Tax=Sulfurovum sp. TaxID=1969726 RepID=UPI0035645FC4